MNTIFHIVRSVTNRKSYELRHYSRYAHHYYLVAGTGVCVPGRGDFLHHQHAVHADSLYSRHVSADGGQ